MKEPQLPDTWDLTKLFTGDDDPAIDEAEAKFKTDTDTFAEKWQENSRYLEDPEVLAEAMADYESYVDLYADGGPVYYYFWLRNTQDQSNATIRAKLNKATELALQMEAKILFFELAIARIPDSEQVRFINHPSLEPYRKYVSDIFEQGRYNLSDDFEKAFTLKADVAHGKWVAMTSELVDSEMRRVLTDAGKVEELTLEGLLGLLQSREKGVRDQAAEAINEILAKYAEVATRELNAVLANKKIEDKLRGYERPESARFLGDDIEPEVVDMALEAVTGRFDISNRFYRLKADLLGVSQLAYHERNIEEAAFDKEYTFDESVQIVGRMFESLDPEFKTIYDRLLEEGHVDVYPHSGKWGGAFCTDNAHALPAYLLLNHTGKLRDVTTLAHEIGHTIQQELMRDLSPLYYSTSMAIAEISSQYFEEPTIQLLGKDFDEEGQLALLMTSLSDTVNSVFRQLACVRFEQELHLEFRDKGFLSSRDIGMLFQKHMAAYMGPAVEQSAGSENWWVYWSHIREFFYNYSYGMDLIIAYAMYDSAKADPDFAKRLKAMMSAGTSASVVENLKNVGFDITRPEFWQKGLEAIDIKLAQAEALAKKLGKI